MTAFLLVMVWVIGSQVTAVWAQILDPDARDNDWRRVVILALVFWPLLYLAVLFNAALQLVAQSGRRSG